MNIAWLTKVALVETTAKECSKWGLIMFPILGNTSEEKLGQIQVMQSLEPATGAVHIVLNYESLNNAPVKKALQKTKWDVIVIDEVHRLKGGANPTPTQIWENARDFINSQRENGCFPFFLSGSIINNKPEELWAYLHLFDPDRFDNLYTFKSVFADQVWIQGSGFTPRKLIETLAPNMVRRTKSEVASQLPPKTYLDPEMISLDKKSDLYALHQKLIQDVLIEFDGISEDAPFTVTAMLAKLHYLRMLLLAPGVMPYTSYRVNPETGEREKLPKGPPLEFKPPYTKLEYMLQAIEDVIDEGENVLVFSAQYNAPIDWMNEKCAALGIRSDVLKGGSNIADLQRRFQQNELQAMFVNLKSGAEGLNLQRSKLWPGGASHVFFLDRWWNPELNRQGEDRVYRVDTVNPVFIHKFYVENSVDLIIRDIEENKIAENEKITENKAFRAGDWKELLGKYLK